MRASTFLQIVLGFAGLLAVWAGYELSRPPLFGLGAVLLAGMMIAMGISAFRTREHQTARMSVNVPHGGPFTFRGTAAVLKGTVFILLGVAGLAAALTWTLEMEQAALHHLTRRPGLALLGVGALLASWGSARILGAVEWRASLGDILRTLPERYSGLLMVILGLGAASVGLWEILDPAAFDRLIAGIFGADARLAQ